MISSAIDERNEWNHFSNLRKCLKCCSVIGFSGYLFVSVSVWYPINVLGDELRECY